MPHFIKGFWDIKKDTSHFKPIIKRLIYFVGYRKKLLNTGVSWLETRLVWENQIVFYKKTENFIKYLSQVFFHKLEAMRLVSSFSNIVYHLSYELGLYWLFTILTEKNQCQNIGNKVQRFTNWFTANFYHANTDPIMTVSFVWI